MEMSSSLWGQCCVGPRGLQARLYVPLRQRVRALPRSCASRRSVTTIRALKHVSQHETPVSAPVIVNEKGIVVRSCN